MTYPCSGKSRDRIRQQLADLKMPGALESLDQVLAAVDRGRATPADTIEQFLAAQISLRNSRRLVAAMRSSRLPAIKTLADFDFSFQSSVKREQLESLHELGFIERHENVILLGPPGVGKSHLAISLAAAQSGPCGTTAPWQPSSLHLRGRLCRALIAPAEDARFPVAPSRR